MQGGRTPAVLPALAAALLSLAAGAACYPLLRGTGGGTLPAAVPAGQLPAALHALGFALLLLLVLRPWPRWQAPAVAAWAVLLCLAELAQLAAPAGPPPAGTAAAWAAAPGQLLAAHLGGTFDPLDLVASVLGAAAALCIHPPSAVPAAAYAGTGQSPASSGGSRP